ncbi:uncharacterized protein PAC_19517 [Phialocephala subalpina]|uniref:Heterokaryon incompatibility domain-containing protein n=1 Tax=Phialocephala subalpina TaxID=576137 RepID=A0A1L7XX83_9HELO|nr:uncharacterized protein PAC_19517 [Phialocephala subalpina]
MQDSKNLHSYEHKFRAAGTAICAEKRCTLRYNQNLDEVSDGGKKFIVTGMAQAVRGHQDHDQLRLLDIDNFPSTQPMKYAALSYCWGPQKGTFVSTRENIESSKRGIVLSELPRTIQDAIKVYRGIGLQYLWVDALCIIQNDVGEQDWYEQSGKMRQIYSNSHVTIAADHSSSCIDGFLESYGRDWTQLNHKDASNTSPPVWIRPIESNVGTSMDVLSTRGWALQESVLPNRILHFASGGLRWDCNTCSRSEDGSPGYDPLKLAFRTLRVIKLGRASLQLPPPGTFGNVVREDEGSTHITDFLTTHTPRSVYYAWRAIVELYSTRQLTKQNDRLSAISGLASLVVEYMDLQPSTYLAELWLDDLSEGLLWVSGGFVTVRGKVVPVHLNVIPIPQGYKSEYNGANGNAQRTHIDRLVLVRSRTGQDRHNYEILDDVRLSGLSLRQESTYDSCWVKGSCSDKRCGCHFASNGSRTFCCLKVGVTTDTGSDGQRHWWLLLEQLPGNKNVYQRVGLGYYQVLYRGFHLFVNTESHTITIV